MKSDLMQHVQDCASNAVQDFVRDDVPSESSVDLCDDHSNLRVSDEIDHFLHKLSANIQERLRPKLLAT